MSSREDAEGRATRFEKEVHELQTHVSYLREEIALLQRRLSESPHASRALEQRLADTLRFNPWHALPKHRPLGNQNRARRTIYATLADVRQRMNATPHVEPTKRDWFAPSAGASHRGGGVGSGT